MRFLVVPLLLAAAACQPSSTYTPASAPSAFVAVSDPSAAAPYADDDFVREMAAHHTTAVEMAALARHRVARPDVRALAAAMQADRMRDIEALEAWLHARAEAPVNMVAAYPAHEFGMPMTMAEFVAAPDLDRAFLVSALGHHARAVEMAARAIAFSTDADVQRLARAVVRVQTDELVAVQRLLNRAVPAPSPTAASGAEARVGG